MKLSLRGIQELVSHEAIVLEAYKDSKGIWTWGIGVTNASGHNVTRYKDNPQPLDKVLAVFEWLLRTKYIPDVLKAFKGYALTEHELAAAVSFHYNTGAILKATWVKLLVAGKRDEARTAFMRYRLPNEIIPRRLAERDLFFDGKWKGGTHSIIYTQVRRPSYQPRWSSAKKVDIRPALKTLGL